MKNKDNKYNLSLLIMSPHFIILCVPEIICFYCIYMAEMLYVFVI